MVPRVFFLFFLNNGYLIIWEQNQIFFRYCFPSKIRSLWCCKPPVPLVGQKTRALHEILTRLVITENTFSGMFSNNQPCQYFMESKGFFGQPKVQEAYNITILKIFGSMESPLTSVLNDLHLMTCHFSKWNFAYYLFSLICFRAA